MLKYTIKKMVINSLKYFPKLFFKKLEKIHRQIHY